MIRALRRGKRELTRRERNSLVGLHNAMDRAITDVGWLSDAHTAAADRLAGRCAQLAGDGVPYSHLADALHVHKSRVGRLVLRGREVRP